MLDYSCRISAHESKILQEAFLDTKQATTTSADEIIETDDHTGDPLENIAVGNHAVDSSILARQIVDIVEDKQASDILLLDIGEHTSIADYFIIATVGNERQARAIEDDLMQKLRIEQNIRPLNMEGVDGRGSGWALLDYGDVIIHLFTPEARIRYDLEGLWNQATIVLKML